MLENEVSISPDSPRFNDFAKEFEKLLDKLPISEHDNLHDECAVFGIYFNDKNKKAAPYVFNGLFALQHRGQEGSGISSSNSEQIFSEKDAGLVTSVFNSRRIEKLPGHIAIGHDRYSTNGGALEHLQPATSAKNKIAVAHNGNLPVVIELKRFLNNHNISIEGLNDSELIQRAIEYYVEQGLSLEDAVTEAYPLFTGAFSLVIMDNEKLIGVRDNFGIRPLVLGEFEDNKGFVLSSETCALDKVGAKYLRSVKAGEMVVIDKNGLESKQLREGHEQLDIFEIFYFANPSSKIEGRSPSDLRIIEDLRYKIGRQLAKEVNINADIVIGVPNSAIPAAEGFADESGMHFTSRGLLKSSYAHRTFISPDERGKKVEMKFTPMGNVLEGLSVAVIDDSIVRGTTSKELVQMLRDAGAKEVHLLSAAPMIKYPDFYGIDMPDPEELIAFGRSLEEITEIIGADSVHYLSLDGLFEAIDLPRDRFTISCFTGRYPIYIGYENSEKIGHFIRSNVA